MKKMMKKIYALLLLIVPATSFAGFAVVEEAPKPQAPAMKAAPAPGATTAPAAEDKFQSTIELVAVNYVGAPEKEIEVRNGFGRDVRLIDALKQIAPAGWNVFFTDNLVTKLDKRTISWRGGRRWVEILDIVSNDQGLTVDVMWKKRQLFVQERKTSAATPTRTVKAETPVWIARSGSTLRESVTEWAVKAGWEMRWLQEDLDYPIPGRLTYEGSFESAITGIFRAYEKAARPLVVDGNAKQKILMIKEGER